MSAFKETTEKKNNKWHSPFFFVFEEDELDVVLCVEASKVHAHTQAFSLLSTD